MHFIIRHSYHVRVLPLVEAIAHQGQWCSRNAPLHFSSSFPSLPPPPILLPSLSPYFTPHFSPPIPKWLTSAVAFISMVVIPVWPLSMASLCDISRLTGLTSAPCCNSTATTSLCPFLVAAMRGVTPNLSARFGFTPFSRRQVCHHGVPLRGRVD